MRFDDDDVYSDGKFIWRFLPWRWKRNAARILVLLILAVPGLGFSVVMFIGEMRTRPLLDYIEDFRERTGVTVPPASTSTVP